MSKRVIGYVRVSTSEQAAGDKFGPVAQREAIKKYCEEHDLQLIEWFEDLGVSGAVEHEDDREAMNQIIYGDVKNPPIEGIVVYKLDRIARDMNLFFYYKMLLQKKDIEILSVTDETGMFGEFSGVIEAFLMFVAQQERRNITLRTLSGRKLKAKRGGYAGGRIPLGYILKDGKWVIDEKEAHIVRFIFEANALGETSYRIAKVLRDRNIVSKQGGEFTTRQIINILNNRKTYEGYYKFSDVDWVKGDFEPILKPGEK